MKGPWHRPRERSVSAPGTKRVPHPVISGHVPSSRLESRPAAGVASRAARRRPPVCPAGPSPANAPCEDGDERMIQAVKDLGKQRAVRGWRGMRRGWDRTKPCRAACPRRGRRATYTGPAGSRCARRGRTAADRCAARTRCLPSRMLSQTDGAKKQGPPSRESPIKGTADVSRSMACAEERMARQRPWTALPVLPGPCGHRPGREPLSGRTDAGCANSPS